MASQLAMHAAQDARSKFWTKSITPDQLEHIKTHAYYNREDAVSPEDLASFRDDDFEEEHFLVCAKTVCLHLDTNQLVRGFRVLLPISLLVD